MFLSCGALLKDDSGDFTHGDGGSFFVHLRD